MSIIRKVFSRWLGHVAPAQAEPACFPPKGTQPQSSSFELAGTTEQEIYKKLVARVDRAPTRMKIEVMEKCVSSPTIGDKQVVGGLFESLFTHGTADEWKDEIYPGLLAIIHDTSVKHPDVVSKRAFLAWLVKGIMSQS